MSVLSGSVSRHLALIFLATLLGTSASAQLITLDNTTSPPAPGVGHDYIRSFSETVNPQNGSLSVRIDLPMPNGRGLKVPFAFTYNSNSVRRVGGSLNAGGAFFSDSALPTLGGWTNSVPTLTATQGQNSFFNDTAWPPTTYICTFINNYNFSDWSGAIHPLNLGIAQAATSPTNGCNQDSSLAAGWQTLGGDGVFQASTTNWCASCGAVTAPNPVQVVDSDGTVYSFPGSFSIDGSLNQYNLATENPSYAQQYNTGFGASVSTIEDRNGNVLTFTFGSSGTIIDDAGRTLVTMTEGSQSGTVTVLGQSTPYTLTYGSTPVNFNVNSTVFGQGADPTRCKGVAGLSGGSITVVTALTLPNGQKFKFYYDQNYGLLNEIVYPNGGYVKYTWGVNPQSESAQFPTLPIVNGNYETCFAIYDYPAITQRTVSYDGSTIAETQEFSYSTTITETSIVWTSKSTTVTTSDAVRGTAYQTAYTYAPFRFQLSFNEPGTEAPAQLATEKSIVSYDFNGNVLRSEYKSFGGPNANQLQCDLIELDNGLISGAWYTYGPGSEITDKKEYDYGVITSASCPVAAPSNPTRETVTTYQTFNPTAIFPSAASIFDRPASVQVYNGSAASGTLASEMDNVYDGVGVTSAGTVTGHDDTNYGTVNNTRGNLTQKTAKCIGCTNSVTTYKYDTTGQILTKTDPCGNGTCADMAGTTHTTTYGYADNYTVLSSGSNTSYTPPTQTNAYLTTVTDNMGHITTFSYDYDAGELTSVTDPNNQITHYTYNDSFWRPTSISYPDSGSTTYSYNDAPYNASAGTPSETVTKLVTTGTNIVTTTSFDGMHHPVLTKLTSDPDGVTSTATTYDGLGKIYTVTNPYRSTSDSTYGITKNTYDALGRTVTVQKPDGSSVQSFYDQLCSATANAAGTTVIDEAGNLRESCSDGLGRLVEVDEPGAGSAAASAGTATVTISGSEQSPTGTPGSGSISISGGSANCIEVGNNPPVYAGQQATIYVVINGETATSGWSGTCNGTVETIGETLSQFVANVASEINSSGANVTATINGTKCNNNPLCITLIANTTNNSDYSILITETYAFSTSQAGTGYTVCCNGSLTGGSNGGPDTGIVSLTVNNESVASHTWGATDTALSIASALGSQVTSPVSAQASSTTNGAKIVLTADDVGPAGNYSLSASVQDTAGLSPSFSISAPSGLTGGSDGTLGTGPLVTLYSYDPLNNLVSVQQQGGASSASWRNRTFTYDSLSRLMCAANPEVQAVTCPSSASGTLPFGAVTYSYDANGNLSSMVMPKADLTTGTSVTTHNYTYDVMNRLTQETHLDPSAGSDLYGYDGIPISGCPGLAPPTISCSANLIGRRSATCTNNSSSSFGYDPMGRTSCDARTNKGLSTTTFTVGYTYWKDGSLNTLTYPSGDVITYTVGGAGRPTKVSDSTNTYVTTPPNWPTAPMYAPGGSLVGMTQGSNIITSNIYNNRLQPILLSAAASGAPVFSLCYDFHLGTPINNSPCQFNSYTSGNNGNVFQVVNNISTDATHQSVYQYDLMNRLSQANSLATSGTNCWSETYTVDAWGNLTNRGAASGMGSCSTEALSAAPATVQNHLTGLNYDLAGNVLNDSLGNAINYDAENRIGTDGAYTYAYDADGNRVVKSNGSAGTMYWLGPNGTLTESSLTGSITAEYVFFNGARIARIDKPGTAAKYYFSDKVASSSVITDASGNVLERYFYYPYGGLLTSSGTDSNHYKFDGKERDSESNLDQFGARYYASAIGRFMIPDWAEKPTAVPYAHYGNPQSLNLYTFVQNNPVSLGDPDGHCDPQTGDATNCQPKPTVGQDKDSGGFLQKLDNALNGHGWKTNKEAAAAEAKERADWAKENPNIPYPEIKLGMVTPTGGLGAGGIEVTAARLTKVLEAHTAGGVLSAGKSLFAAGENVESLIQAANSTSRVAQAGGNFERIVDAGRTIGVDRATGAATSIYTVITDSADRMITTFPGKP